LKGSVPRISVEDQNVTMPRSPLTNGSSRRRPLLSRHRKIVIHLPESPSKV
jgi:hypothetical protein